MNVLSLISPIIHASAELGEAVRFEIWDSEGRKTYGMRM